MASEDDLQVSKNMAEMLNSPFSSEGEEEYDEASYGSDFQPPGLASGLVMVHEDCCCARYRPSRVPPGTPYYIFLNKSTCCSLAGGRHSVLRGGQRAEPGAYKGIFGPGGKLLAAKSGTRSTAKAAEQATKEIRASDRAQVEAIKGLTSNEPPGGLSCQDLSLSQAEILVLAESDQEVEGKKSKAPANQNAQFLGLLSSLVTRIEQQTNHPVTKKKKRVDKWI